jgi:hypothetical protein
MKITMARQIIWDAESSVPSPNSDWSWFIEVASGQ